MEFNNKNIKTLKSKKYITDNGFENREECFAHHIKEETANRTLLMSEVERILKTNGQWIKYFNPNTMTKEIKRFCEEFGIKESDVDWGQSQEDITEQIMDLFSNNNSNNF